MSAPNNPMIVQDPLKSPFVAIEGVANIRAVGGYRTTGAQSRSVKSPLLFRSGELSSITDVGKSELLALGIRRVFDMRSDKEISSYQTPAPVINRVEFVRVPVSQKEYDPARLAVLLNGFEMNELDTFVSLYTEMLESGGQAFEAIFKHLRDRPDEPCLVHCTAGKDRTGLLVALVLMLLRVRDEDIINDYTLTTVGLKPLLPALTARFLKHTVYRENWQGTLNMGSAKPDTMAAALRLIGEKYGGSEGYLKTYTGLTDEDLDIIRRNSLVEDVFSITEN